ncbi:MAG: hypothetical protein JOY90_07065 [Bradyrhizobium sp.]|nr:hypothetical protein [Bradyrhizobium sp.]
MNEEKLALLAQVPEADYMALFESASGEQLDRVVSSALTYRQISNATNNMTTVIAKAEGALRTIGRKSRLNALRLQKYGVSLDDPTGERE